MTSARDRRLLDGIRVLDFTRVMAGPYCTALLADLGADVVKVEPPGGDDYRHVGPFKEGESALFLLVNRRKRGIVLDLKTAQGVEIARALAARADVVVENFRPGVAKRLGIDYESLRAGNPGLVYASISGFGQKSPMGDLPSYDIVAQAMTGLMAMTGEPDGPPTMVGESMGDLAAAMFASWGILAALLARERTGEGRYLDVALFDSLFSLLPTPLCQVLHADRRPTRVGNRHQISAPFGVFRSGDGHVVIAVLTERQFAALAEVAGCPEIVDDPRFQSDETRERNEPALRARIEDWTTRLPTAAIVEALGRAGVPVSPIWEIAEAARSEQVAARGLVTSARHGTLGPLPVVEQPVHFTDSARGGATAAPGLGEHTDEILREILDLDPERIRALRDAGAIR